MANNEVIVINNLIASTDKVVVPWIAIINFKTPKKKVGKKVVIVYLH